MIKLFREEMLNTEKLDYSLKTAKERKDFVSKVVAATPAKELNKKYIEVLSDYIVSAMTPEEKKSKMILTDNRMITINKRETSYQGLAESFESGEDGLYNLMIDDKNRLLTHKYKITEKDLNEIKPLKDLRESIAAVEKMEKEATGKRKFLLKKQLIEMHQEQYIIKNFYKENAVMPSNGGSSKLIKGFSKMKIEENITIDENGEPVSNSVISFFNPIHVSALLCNYSSLKEDV